MEVKPLTERERIDALTFRLCLSIRQLARMVGMNENTFYHITDNSRFGISERTASRICYYLEKNMNVVVNRDWLLTGVGEMFDEKRSTLPQEEDNGDLVASAAESTDSAWKAKYIDLLERYTALLESRKS